MEDMLLKVGEFGALAFICGYLLTKGTAVIKDLANSVDKLADNVAKQSEQIGNLNNRVTSFEFQLRGIESRLDKIENSLNQIVAAKATNARVRQVGKVQ